MHDHTVTLLPSGAKQSFPPGTVLSDALLDMGMELKTPCGGKGTCGKCLVQVEGMPGKVLACRTPVDRDLAVHALPGETGQPERFTEISHSSRFAIAADIGTTTVKLSLVDITQGTSYEIASFLNPQRRFGHDVISRIAAGSDESGAKALQETIARAIDHQLNRAFRSMGLEPAKVERIVFSGNTAMLYLLFGIDVKPLGRHPYAAAVRDFPEIRAEEIGLGCIANAQACAFPVLGAFLGSDLIGGLTLCLDAGITANAFFIDLGTNGELFVLDREGRPHATSCAMGPALEGMNISCGMTADDGAVTHIFEQDGSLGYEMIGHGKPAGITGTALVDLMAIALDRGAVSPDGAFKQDTDRSLSPLHIEENRGRKELLLRGDLRLTQQDVRAVQLAKAASLSAARILLEQAGCTPADIRHVLVAGAFGEHLNLEHFGRLGFIPDFANARQEFLGNTSLKAAGKACLEPDFMQRVAELRDRTREVALSDRPDFQDMFLQSLNFPARRKVS